MWDVLYRVRGALNGMWRSDEASEQEKRRLNRISVVMSRI
jgi:hypothetical protein